MAGELRSVNPVTARRRREEQGRAKSRLRGKSKNRKSFDDQSTVDKLYRWLTKERPYYENPFTGEKVPGPKPTPKK